jgi:hypothetical protein
MRYYVLCRTSTTAEFGAADYVAGAIFCLQQVSDFAKKCRTSNGQQHGIS